MTLDDFSAQELEWFLSIGFSHHYEILIKSKSLQERLYYIRRCATEFWSVDKLRYMFMGVAKYKTADELPPAVRNALPNPDDLKKLL